MRALGQSHAVTGSRDARIHGAEDMTGQNAAGTGPEPEPGPCMVSLQLVTTFIDILKQKNNLKSRKIPNSQYEQLIRNN